MLADLANVARWVGDRYLYAGLLGEVRPSAYCSVDELALELTFEHDHEQSDVSEGEECLLPDVVEDAGQWGPKDDSDGDLRRRRERLRGHR